MLFQLIVIWFHFLCICICGKSFEAFNDNVLFQINWPGPSDIDLSKLARPGIEYKSADSFIVTSSAKEQYQCTIPSLTASSSSFNKDGINSKSITELLAPILNSETCIYIVESYWTYELCHGKYVRQFHEERTRKTASNVAATYVIKSENGKVVLQQDDKTDLIKTTEYYLGYFKNSDSSQISESNVPTSADKVLKKNINGVKTPYFALNVTGGTPCDLKSGLMRRSTILYVCGQVARATLFSISETSSCEYELIVLTSELCKHPFYKVQGKEVNQIQCVPIADAPAKPSALTKFLEGQSKDASHSQKKIFASPVQTETTETIPTQTIETVISPLVDKSLLRDFLSGSYCLHGGSGWWRFEYCYGRYVQQYHDDKLTGRTAITVGHWDEEAHLEWAAKTSSSPVISKKGDQDQRLVTQVSHFYGNGDVCDETGKPREVVVRMKCKKNSSSPHSVALYLLEPRTCSYILGVESPIFCDLLDSANEQGLFSPIT